MGDEWLFELMENPASVKVADSLKGYPTPSLRTSPSPCGDSFSLGERSPFGFQIELSPSRYTQNIPCCPGTNVPSWDDLISSKRVTSKTFLRSDDEIHKLFAGWSELDLIHGGQESLSHIQSQLRVCSLERYNGELLEKFQRLLDPSNKRAFLQLFDFGFYYLSNNLLSEMQTDKFLKWAIENDLVEVMKSYFENQLSTIHASATKILKSALRIGDAEFLQFLIDSEIDKSPLKGIYGGKCLARVASKGHMTIARILLDCGAEINVPVSKEFPETALYQATSHNRVEIVELLLQAGAEVDTLCFYEECPTALSIAIEQHSTQLVGMLIRAGANVDECRFKEDNVSFPALKWSALHCSQELHSILVEASEHHTNSICADGILEAANAGTQCLSDYLAKCSKSAYCGMEERLQERALLEAAADEEGTHKNAIISLLKIGVDPNAAEKGEPVILEAVRAGNFETIKILINAGADLNTPDLLSAALWQKNNVKLFEALLKEEGLDITICGGRALQAAARLKNLDAIQSLLFHGANVNEPVTEAGGTALQLAADDIEIIRVLLKAGADINAPAPGGGFTALQHAALCSKIDIVQELLQAGADVNAPAAEFLGNTALQAAVGSGEKKIVRILLDAGADVNAPGSMLDGRTALQQACGEVR